MVNRYAGKIGIKYDVHGFCVHSTRATAITNALENGADIGQGSGMGRPCQHLHDTVI